MFTTVSLLYQVLISQPALPVYLHCTDGAHHTGGVLMCLRKLQVPCVVFSSLIAM